MPAWTLGDLMSNATAALGNRADITASTVSLWVNQAYFDIAGLFVHTYQETSAVTSTVAGSGVILLPTDFESLLGPPSNLSRNNLSLRPISIDQLASFNTTQAAPVYYASYGTRLEVRPLPDSAHSIEIRYRAAPADMTATTTTPSVATRLRPAIFHRAVELLAQNVTLDMERAALAKADLTAILSQLPNDRMLARRDARELRASDPASPAPITRVKDA